MFLVCLLGAGTCCSCFATTVGFQDRLALDTHDFGPAKTINVCVYLDRGIDEQQARSLLSSWDSKAPLYGLYIKPIMFADHPRVGFFHDDILDDVSSIPLAITCDRVLYFSNRNVWDYAYANLPNPVLWPMPEVLGEVDDSTMTHGFVVAQPDSINGLMISPSHVTRQTVPPHRGMSSRVVDGSMLRSDRAA